ncbi:glycoside hydrolase family 25 domain-containing protein [Amnibacterium setariae]|uniref:hypothetical protein n=1 Tax=Amnibacterium setariae TaxID=2306585 RepID=UPI001314A60E|nr:hypothetical protein [Amnibacterium setariae]
MRRWTVLATAAVAAALTVGAAPAAHADGPVRTTTATGHDVSYPQCGRELPVRGDIAVVGVNAGTGTTSNPCLADQLLWGDVPAADGSPRLADVYVNTANPGHLGDWWPAADLTRTGSPVVNPQGRCTGAENAACAYVYGYSIGVDDLHARGVVSAADRTWWLDVETMNSWSWDRDANLASIEGMAAAIRDAGAEVGVYSTPRQWRLIVGDGTPSVALAGAPSWIAGATTKGGALANCGARPFTPGGRIRMVQWVQDDQDHDIACGVGVAGTTPEIDGAGEVGEHLGVRLTGWGPFDLHFDYQWTRDGAPIDGATTGAYTVAPEDAGAAVAVRVTGSRLGAPPLTLTSDPVVVTQPSVAPQLTPGRIAQWGI